MECGVEVSLCGELKTGCEVDAIKPNPTPLISRSARILVGLGAPLLVLLGIRWLLNGGGLLCLFYDTTGLYCPGCGSGRAALALLYGHPLKALEYNPLLFLLGLPCGVLLIWEYLRFVFPGLGLRQIVLPAWAARAALAIVLGFWLLRNVPVFAVLAP